jgi:hypothetical protein
VRAADTLRYLRKINERCDFTDQELRVMVFDTENVPLQAALLYASLGWRVFPCHTPIKNGCSCGKSCDNIGKHPRTEHGYLDATTDAPQIRAWWEQWPRANIGIATGGDSGIVVLDIDPDKGGALSLDDLLAQHEPLPDTIESLTGGGGRHIMFAHPGIAIKSSGGELGAGLDSRGDGGYIIAPPSLHKSGKRYEWEASSHPLDVPLAPMPTWLVELTRKADNATGTPPQTLRRHQALRWTWRSCLSPSRKGNATISCFAMPADCGAKTWRSLKLRCWS